MIWKLSLMLPRITLALLLLLPAAASAQDLDTAVSALVRISGTRAGTPVRGSGFVVGLDLNKATIVTASHVIEGVQQLEVTFAVDLTESFSAGAVLGMESGNPRGLAVFLVRGALPAGVTTLSFGTEDQLQRGEDVFLLGFPEMATAPLALRMSFAGPDGNFLRLDRPAGEGLSGAPVLRNGKAVGVVTEEDPRLTYAVKASMAQGAVIGWGGKLGGQVVEECRAGELRTESGIDYVRICPGTFTMGSAENDPQAYDDERPAHQVTLKSEIWIGKTEITNKQYRRFQRNHQGEDELPATGVSWDEAKAACESFGGRLPTEAEWEYAARAGSRTAWSFGDDEKLLGEHAWYAENSDNKPHPVATRKPNGWGLYDMHGNVQEWVADWRAPYKKGPQTDPTGPETGEYRVLRGGAFNLSPRFLRSADRFRFGPVFRGRVIGFRCARSPGRQP
jgi:sulfatase-modifying factor enzyme 1/trypsin-like peptidase